MKYGTAKTRKSDGDTTVSIIEDFHKGDISRTIKCVKVRIKVNNSQQEMEEFIAFTKELMDKWNSGKLVIDAKDPETYPAIIWDLPKKNLDGSYFILKTVTEVLK